MRSNPAEIFKILGVKTRIGIIDILKNKGPVGANYIAEELGITPAAASQHLKILKHAGLVRSERHGFRIPYTIDEEAMGHCQQMLSEVCECGCPGAGGFKTGEMKKADLDSLKAYKDKLLKKLELIEKRIEEIESGGD